MGLEPAKLEHATAFGATYPDVQREYPIVFPGSSWVDPRGHRCVPCLGFWVGYVPCLGFWVVRRRLSLGWWDLGWGREYRCAAVRKVPVVL